MTFENEFLIHVLKMYRGSKPRRKANQRKLKTKPSANVKKIPRRKSSPQTIPGRKTSPQTILGRKTSPQTIPGRKTSPQTIPGRKTSPQKKTSPKKIPGKKTSPKKIRGKKATKTKEYRKNSILNELEPFLKKIYNKVQSQLQDCNPHDLENCLKTVTVNQIHEMIRIAKDDITEIINENTNYIEIQNIHFTSTEVKKLLNILFKVFVDLINYLVEKGLGERIMYQEVILILNNIQKFSKFKCAMLSIGLTTCALDIMKSVTIESWIYLLIKILTENTEEKEPLYELKTFLTNKFQEEEKTHIQAQNAFRCVLRKIAFAPACIDSVQKTTFFDTVLKYIIILFNLPSLEDETYTKNEVKYEFSNKQVLSYFLSKITKKP